MPDEDQQPGSWVHTTNSPKLIFRIISHADPDPTNAAADAAAVAAAAAAFAAAAAAAAAWAAASPVVWTDVPHERCLTPSGCQTEINSLDH